LKRIFSTRNGCDFTKGIKFLAECHEQTRTKTSEELATFLNSLVEDQIKFAGKNRNEMGFSFA
jgi:hypothetical protein